MPFFQWTLNICFEVFPPTPTFNMAGKTDGRTTEQTGVITLNSIAWETEPCTESLYLVSPRKGSCWKSIPKQHRPDWNWPSAGGGSCCAHPLCCFFFSFITSYLCFPFRAATSHFNQIALSIITNPAIRPKQWQDSDKLLLII